MNWNLLQNKPEVFAPHSFHLFIMDLSHLLVFTMFNSLAFGNIVQLRKNTLDKMLRNYDPFLQPHFVGSADSPTQISVNIFISDIFDVSDTKMEYAVQMYLREIWDDPRLRYPDPEGIVQSVPLGTFSKIWTPDLFFNERDGSFHTVQKPNRFVRIFANGKVSFNSRLTMKIRCPMNFKYFPFDRQICSFELESYGFETKDITLKWMEGNPVQVNSKLHMSNFVLEDFGTGYCDKATIYGHGCLSVQFQMKRQYGFYLTQIFIPFLILVAMSWLSLWLDARAVSLRLSLIVILLTLMMFLSLGIQHLLPTTAYTKAIDIWIAVCISLVFACFLQFSLVNQLARREQRVRTYEGHVVRNAGCHNAEEKFTKMKNALEECNHIPLSKKIDFLCRVLFPIAFVLFNCLFWFTYIRGRDSRLLQK